ncbi:MAG: 3-hydroxyacyl-CoA dehydrogenase [Cycloclasticus sp. symbiont of Poecilosclerida sp. M]|nr:MAG: 3-hydroxyacyl-CoA dehydrogenase [Cycloclasticus sp. symbiont of Poecilosclerida sp. M]
MKIETVVVIGAGVMGSGIAAQIANAGKKVLLLDIIPDGADNRNILAETAIQKLIKVKPAALMHKRNAKLITAGNLEDNLADLAHIDWIIEVIIERLDLKQELYKKIDAVRKHGSIVSSNTSTLPLTDLTAGLSEQFANDFLITHFFNPPRYMRLLEIVVGEKTRPAAVDTLRDFCDHQLGKGVVICNDTPGFIANRIGAFWMQTAMLEAFRLGLTVEEADALCGRPMGIPKTGVFGLLDLVGIDIMPHVMNSMTQSLPKNDPFQEQAVIPKLVHKMISDGYTGRKGKGGFYRINKAQGAKIKESINLSDGEYAPSKKALLASLAPHIVKDLQKLVSFDDKGGEFAWSVLSKTLSYSAQLIPEIGDNIDAIDRAMKLGYNWKYGPFELIDKIGADWFIDKLVSEQQSVPPLLLLAQNKHFYKVEDGQRQRLDIKGIYQPIQRDEGILLLADIKLANRPIKKNASASLWDIGDGVLCLEFHSKMNAIDPDILAMIDTAVKIIPNNYKTLVLYNEGENFSVGANIGLALFAANVAAWPQIEAMVRSGQDTYKALKHAPFPVVGAPAGMALGGGCESLLHCDAIQAHAESYIGLVEVGVGLIPAWGGSKEMLSRWMANPKRAKGPMPAISKAFEIISTATVSTSAAEAQNYLFINEADSITMNKERLLFDAKDKALSLVNGYSPKEEIQLALPGATARTALNLAATSFVQSGKATEYDGTIADQLAMVLSGGETDISELQSEDDLYSLERKAFMALIKKDNTLNRVQHMLEAGKPLRN